MPGVVTTQRLTHEQRRTQTRAAVLDAAAAVFARRGYEAGTLEEIAEAAGYTTGAIYSNFAGKEELFLAVFERRNAQLTDVYRDLLEEAGGKPPELVDVAQVWSRHELADRDALLLTLEFRLAALRDPALGGKLGEFEAQTEETIARFIAERLRAVGLPDPPVPVKEYAALIYAANQGIWQHVAVCATDHSTLFEHFLTLMGGAWWQSDADPGS